MQVPPTKLSTQQKEFAASAAEAAGQSRATTNKALPLAEALGGESELLYVGSCCEFDLQQSFVCLIVL
jgi:hypothetical protein